MATPTTKLQIDVDLQNGKITKIRDPTKEVSIEPNISLDQGELETSKLLFNQNFNNINKQPINMVRGLMGKKHIKPISLTPASLSQMSNRDGQNLMASNKPVKPARLENTKQLAEMVKAEANEAKDTADLLGLNDVNNDNTQLQYPTNTNTDANDILNLGADIYLNKNAPQPPIPDSAPNGNLDSLPHINDDEDFGGARKRRLSRRRQRGSNKKKFLVRNKSKKMRRGKYTRKAK